MFFPPKYGIIKAVKKAEDRRIQGKRKDRSMKRFLSVVLAVLVFVTSIPAAGFEVQAEEDTGKDIEECTFVEMRAECRYAGSGEKVIMLPPQRYTGSEIKPDVIIKDGDYVLKEGTDYITSQLPPGSGFTDNVNVNTTPWNIFSKRYSIDKYPGMNIYGRGRYKGSVECIFAILSENQKETPDHFIYEDSTGLEGFQGGLSIVGYVGMKTDVVIPERIDGKPVYEIGDFAFRCNRLISNVRIPDTVVCVGDNAFVSCLNLQEVRLSSQLKHILNWVFCDCPSLEAVHADAYAVYDINGVLYARDDGYVDLYRYPPVRKAAETFVIPDGVERIYDGAFQDVGSIKNIVVPSTVRVLRRGVLGQNGCFAGMDAPVNLIFKHSDPKFISAYADGRGVFHELPTGSTITVKNESMKSAVEDNLADSGDSGRITVILDSRGTPATGLSCTEQKVTLSKTGQEKHRLSWTQTPKETTEGVHWKSSDERVATVEEYSGIIEAKNYGACTVTGRDESGHQVSVSVQVYDPCTIHKFELDASNKKSHTINIKGGVLATAQANGYAGEMPIRFENSNSNVVKVERDSDPDFANEVHIAAKKEGTAVVTAIFDDNGKEIRESVTVHVVGGDSGKPESPKNPGDSNKKKAQEIKYTKSYRKAYGSKPFTLNAKRKKGNGKLTFSSSNAKIASVHRTSGKVTVKGTGRAVITVTAAETKTYKKKSVKITIDVEPGKQTVKSIKVKNRKLTVKWKKDNRADGYQLQYSQDKKFKKKVSSQTIKNRKTISKTTPKLKKGKTYYVRVRSYKNIKVNGKTKKLYGSWSKVKKRGKIK